VRRSHPLVPAPWPNSEKANLVKTDALLRPLTFRRRGNRTRMLRSAKLGKALRRLTIRSNPSARYFPLEDHSPVENGYVDSYILYLCWIDMKDVVRKNHEIGKFS